jgi:hypothetical protein
VDRWKNLPRFLVTWGLGIVISATCVSAESLWDHNGSIVVLEAHGSIRKFYYQNPRIGLSVTPGALLFEGRRTENRYSGTAFLFLKNCEPIGYAVRGPVSQDQRRITLRGKAPRRDANCNVVSYRDDVLRFEFKDMARAEPNNEVRSSNDTEDDITIASAQNTTATELLRYSVMCVAEPRFIDETWKEIRSARYVGNDRVFKVHIKKHKGNLGAKDVPVTLVEIVDELSLRFDQIDDASSTGPILTLNCKSNSKCVTNHTVVNPNTSEASTRRARLSTAKMRFCDEHAANDAVLAINYLKQ